MASKFYLHYAELHISSSIRYENTLLKNGFQMLYSQKKFISFNCFSEYSCNLHSPRFFIFTLSIAHDLKPSRKCKNICVITRRDKILLDIVLLSPQNRINYILINFFYLTLKILNF